MFVQIGDKVAIVPAIGSPAESVSDIATITHAGSVFIELVNGRRFCAVGFREIGGFDYIVPATDQHHEAMKNKRPVVAKPIVLAPPISRRKHPGRAPGRPKLPR